MWGVGWDMTTRIVKETEDSGFVREWLAIWNIWDDFWSR